jgi:hypothetical protein
MNGFGELDELVKTTVMFLTFFVGMAGALVGIGDLIRPEEKPQSREAEQAKVDDLKFEYDALSQKVSTRESSTLAIATFTAAGALVFFALLLETEKADWRIYVLGATLLVGGILYRELTVFTIDRVQFSRIRSLEDNKTLFPNGVPRVHWFWRFLRSLAFRVALVYPPAFFLRYMAYTVPLPENVVGFFLIILLPYPVIFSAAESCMIRRK